MKFLLLYLLLPFSLFAAKTIKIPKDATHPTGIVVFLPDAFDGTIPYPALIELVGAGGTGTGSATDLDKLINDLPADVKTAVDAFGFIMICPQTSGAYTFGEQEDAYQYLVKNYNVDTKSIAMSGYSLGGGGTWWYAEQSVANASKLSCIIPVATTYQVGNPAVITQAGLPVWAFHNLFDNNGATPANATKQQVDGINAANPLVPAFYTFFNVTGHDSWTATYNNTKIIIPAGSQGLVALSFNTVFSWMKANKLGAPVPANGIAPIPIVSVVSFGVNNNGVITIRFSDGSTKPATNFVNDLLNKKYIFTLQDNSTITVNY